MGCLEVRLQELVLELAVEVEGRQVHNNDSKRDYPVLSSRTLRALRVGTYYKRPRVHPVGLGPVQDKRKKRGQLAHLQEAHLSLS